MNKLVTLPNHLRYGIGVPVVISLAIACLWASPIAEACSLAGGSAGICSTAVVENGLPLGVQSAVNWDSIPDTPGLDRSCKANMGRAPYASARFTSSGAGALRTGINSGSSYEWVTWLSKAGRGNASIPVTINYGATSIPLQINDLVFICGPLVTPNLSTAYPNCSTNITGNSFVNSSVRWVTTTSNANDRAPNPVHSGCTYPSQTLTKTLITSLTVDKAKSTFDGTVTGAGQLFINARDEDSRYWAAVPRLIQYTPASPIITNGQVRLIMKYRKYTGYFSTNDTLATKNCANTGPDGVVGAPLNINLCGETTVYLLLSFVINSNYSLNPVITTSPTLLQPAQNVIHVKPTVGNTGSTASPPDDWQVTRFVVPAGSSYGMNAGALIPCSQFTGYRAGSCKSVRNGTFTFPVGTTALGEFDDVVSDEPPGTKICYVLTVNPGSVAAKTWKHAIPACSIVAKIPQVQIWGNDIRAGSSFLGISGTVSKKASVITAAPIRVGTQLYGSWGEYGMVAPSDGLATPVAFGVVSSASGGALSGTTGGASTLTAAQQNSLTFANKDTPYGRWGLPGAFPAVANASAFATGTNDPAASININTKSGIINLTKPSVKVSGTLSPATKTLVLKSAGDVEIDGDILYGNNSFSSSATVQQVVIIARNIKINHGVGVVNSWLIAQPDAGGNGGVISTCDAPIATYYSDLRVGGVCDTKQLRINGLVMAKELQLRRTYGADKSNGLATPGEVINMRPDAYLWALAQSSATGQITTMVTTELSPRF